LSTGRLVYRRVSTDSPRALERARRRFDDQGMKRGDWARDPLALRRESRDGAITVAKLGLLGVPARTAYRRCVPGGPWQRPLPGIVLLNSAEPTRNQLVEAALLYAGPHAVVTGAEACRRLGLRVPDGDPRVHLLVPDERKVKSSDYVIVERTIRLPVPVVRAGVPLAPLVRAVLDECRRSRAFDPVGALLTDAVQRGRLNPHHLLRELAEGSQRGTAVPREVLRGVVGGARSVAEIDAMAVWTRSGLPPADWNFELRDSAGRYIANPDAWCDQVGMAWEIDSYDFHFGREGYANTLGRNVRYTSAGVLVVQTLPTRLRTDPVAVAEELRATYRAAAARPRPEVHAIPRPHMP
jgi:hypothetical protein